jgi:hypothetical protein
VREVVFPVVGEDNLRNLVAEYKSSGSTYRRTVATTYRASYSNHYRRGLIRLLDAAGDPRRIRWRNLPSLLLTACAPRSANAEERPPPYRGAGCTPAPSATRTTASLSAGTPAASFLKEWGRSTPDGWEFVSGLS